MIQQLDDVVGAAVFGERRIRSHYRHVLAPCKVRGKTAIAEGPQHKIHHEKSGPAGTGA